MNPARGHLPTSPSGIAPQGSERHPSYLFTLLSDNYPLVILPLFVVANTVALT